jgi:hypothetical protein
VKIKRTNKLGRKRLCAIKYVSLKRRSGRTFPARNILGKLPSVIKHVRHIRHTARIPSRNICVKCHHIPKRTFHVGHETSVPFRHRSILASNTSPIGGVKTLLGLSQTRINRIEKI